jgi:hypothetical protein
MIEFTYPVVGSVVIKYLPLAVRTVLGKAELDCDPVTIAVTELERIALVLVVTAFVGLKIPPGANKPTPCALADQDKAHKDKTATILIVRFIFIL